MTINWPGLDALNSAAGWFAARATGPIYQKSGGILSREEEGRMVFGLGSSALVFGLCTLDLVRTPKSKDQSPKANEVTSDN